MTGPRKENDEDPIEKFTNAKADAQIRYLFALASVKGFTVLDRLKSDLESKRKENEAQEPGVSDIDQRIAINGAIRIINEFKKEIVTQFINLSAEQRIEKLDHQFRNHGEDDVKLLLSEMNKQLKSETAKQLTEPDLNFSTKLVHAIEATKKFLGSPSSKQAAMAKPDKSQSDKTHHRETRRP